MEIPLTITAGDTLNFTDTASDYPASAGWAITYTLLNASAKITLTSSADGDDHEVAVAAATTADYTAGEYKWTATVSDGTDRYTLDTGTVEVLPDPVEQDTYDGRTFAEISLENIEAVLQNKASADNYSYSIAGRSLSKYSWDELITARNYFRAEVRRERNRQIGKSQSNLIKVRFA